MPKQIQIGYDKVPAPVTKQFPQLVDIEGIPLTDAAGNPLLTEEDAILGSFARGEAALSIIINNAIEGIGTPGETYYEINPDYTPDLTFSGSTITTSGNIDLSVFQNGDTIIVSDTIVYDGTYTVSGTPTSTSLTISETFPSESVTKNASSIDLTFNSTTITTAGAVDLSIFNDGEQITITGSSNNDGTYTITGAPSATVITITGSFPVDETDANEIIISSTTSIPPISRGGTITKSGGSPKVTSGLPVNVIQTPAITGVKPGSVPIVEVFPSESEVSSSLLGVPRAEEQLSLFSDVSTYGFDADNWNYYTFSDVNGYPGEWYRKENTQFGRRRYPNFYEGTEEQALYLESFPSQYTFPTGTFQARLSQPTNQFVNYINFIVIGRVLYEKFKDSGGSAFAEKYFLDDTIKIVTSSNEPLDILPGEFQYTLGDRTSGFLQQTEFYFDVDYGPDLQAAFDQIERWTEIFIEIQDGTVQYPDAFTGGSLNYKDTGEADAIQTFCVQECRPGGSSDVESFAILESKKTYRYQPGRISGFTFGIRLQADPASSANYIEWGCSNTSDEYMFQLVGSRLNIVRRSVIPFPNETLRERFGLEIEDQKLKYPVGLSNKQALYETVFERTSWNGDRLDGTGPSGYILSFEDVTMYKIEFSWYGAIGAKFYAYVPSGNGEARWVLMHTLVIENQMTGPIMQNPDLKFKYLLYATETGRIDTPLYVYKYGSSYYIDGGDEGTIRLSSFTTDSKEFLDRKPIIGILPKEEILNSDGIGLENFKKGYPDTISVTSDINARIDIEDVKGSPSGQHFVFQPSLTNGQHPLSRTLPFIFGTEGAGGDPALDVASSSSISLRESELPEVSGVTGFIFDASYIQHPTEDLSIFSPGDEIIVSGSSSKDGRYLVLEYDAGPPNYLAIRYLDGASPTDNGFPGGDDSNADGNAVSIKTTGIKEVEDQAKLIADGIYNVMLDYDSGSILDDQLLSSNVLRRNDYNLNIDSITQMIKPNGDIVEAGSRFDARVSAYNTITASTIPINADEFIIHFMVPNPRDADTNGYHYADFGITFSSKEPKTITTNNGENRLLFGQDDEELGLRDYPFVEYSHYEAQYNILLKAEYREWDPAFGERFMIDSRLEQPLGGNSGYLAAIKGSVTLSSYNIDPNATVPDTTYGPDDQRIYFLGDFPSPSLFDSDPNNVVAEVGINAEATGWYYVGAPQLDGSNRYIIIRKVDQSSLVTITDINNAGAVQTKQIILEDQWNLVSFPSGVEVDPQNPPEVRFDSQSFLVAKAVVFNSQPLYLVLAMKDYAAINNISVEEITPVTTFTHTPNFIVGTTESGNLFYDRFGNSSENNPPSNFKSDQRLSGLRYDSQTGNPLRPGTVLYSFYVEGGKPETFSLKNIFNFDRKYLARGQLNNTAIFFTATSVDGSAGTIEMSLTSREQ